METVVKINKQTVGRDKIARLLQYLSRFLNHSLQNNKGGSLKNLEFQLSTFRKLLRFGRCIDSVYSAVPVLEYPDSTVRYSLVLSKLCNSLFLLADHMLWLGRADVCSINTDKWSYVSNKYWLYSITLNLVRDFYEISIIIKSHRGSLKPKDGVRNINDIFTIILRTLFLLQRNRSIFIDTVKNSCDFFIPLTALGHVKLSPGTVGLLGVISSLAAIAVLVEPCVKLSPA